MGEAVADNNDRELWNEVKKISSTNNKLPTAMDGCTNTDEISNIFAEKYENLYNFVEYQSQDLERLTKDIEQRILSGCPTNANHVHNISVKEVKDAKLHY